MRAGPAHWGGRPARPPPAAAPSPLLLFLYASTFPSVVAVPSPPASSPSPPALYGLRPPRAPFLLPSIFSSVLGHPIFPRRCSPPCVPALLFLPSMALTCLIALSSSSCQLSLSFGHPIFPHPCFPRHVSALLLLPSMHGPCPPHALLLFLSTSSSVLAIPSSTTPALSPCPAILLLPSIALALLPSTFPSVFTIPQPCSAPHIHPFSPCPISIPHSPFPVGSKLPQLLVPLRLGCCWVLLLSLLSLVCPGLPSAQGHGGLSPSCCCPVRETHPELWPAPWQHSKMAATMQVVGLQAKQPRASHSHRLLRRGLATCSSPVLHSVLPMLCVAISLPRPRLSSHPS